MKDKIVEILIKYTHWLWKQRFAEMVAAIGIDGIVKKYLKTIDLTHLYSAEKPDTMTSLELFEHRYNKDQKFSWLEMLDFAEAYAAQYSAGEEVYVECELKDVLIGAPILEAKHGVRTSNSYATFPNDYEGEGIYLKKLTRPAVSEEEIEDLYNKHLTTVNTGIHMEDQMLLNNFKAAIKELNR